MAKFAQFNAQNELSARYDSEIHAIIPASAIEIAEDMFCRTINETDGIWKLDPATGAINKTPFPAPTANQVWQLIKAKRTAVELGGVKVGTKWYHTDDASRIKYLGLFKLAVQALAAGSVGTTVLQYGGVDIKWKTMDGTFINMTVQRAQDVYFAVFGLDMAAFSAAEIHKTAMEAAADPAAYNFSAGWPASYI